MPPTKPDGAKPRTRNAEATRRAVVEAAVGQFAEEGYAKASIDRIVDALAMTKGAVYHHFKDKAQLFEAAFSYVELRFREKLDAGLEGISGARPRLSTSVDLFLVACRDPSYLRIAVLEAPAALSRERRKELGGDHLLGEIANDLASLRGDQDRSSGAAALVFGAASAAGIMLSTVGPSLAAAERQRLGELVMEMVDGLSP
jgi:AcrR family transcriptional regulator